MPDLLGLDAAADPEAWERLGFAVVDGVYTIGGVAIRLGVDGKHVTGWALGGISAGTEIDGLRTIEPAPAAGSAAHPNGTVAIDHLVVLSPRPARTIAALGAHGIEKRGEGTPTNTARPTRRRSSGSAGRCSSSSAPTRRPPRGPPGSSASPSPSTTSTPPPAISATASAG